MISSSLRLFRKGARKTLKKSIVWPPESSVDASLRMSAVIERANPKSLGGGLESDMDQGSSNFNPCLMKKRRSCKNSFGFRTQYPRLFRWSAPERWASATSLGKMFRSVYSPMTAFPADL